MCSFLYYFERELVKSRNDAYTYISNSLIDIAPFLHLQNKFQGFIFDLVTHRIFNVIIMVVICFQATTILIQNDEQSPQMEAAIYWLNSVFVVLFTLECILKLTAFHCHYFTNVWNVHDFTVIVFSITGEVCVCQRFCRAFIQSITMPTKRVTLQKQDDETIFFLKRGNYCLIYLFFLYIFLVL